MAFSETWIPKILDKNSDFFHQNWMNRFLDRNWKVLSCHGKARRVQWPCNERIPHTGRKWEESRGCKVCSQETQPEMRLSSFLLAVRDALSRSWWVKSLNHWYGRVRKLILWKNLLDWLRLGGLLMTSRSGGLKLRAVAGKPSVTKLTLSIFDRKTSNKNFMQLLPHESYMLHYAASLESDNF